jgi:hypothetical protein
MSTQLAFTNEGRITPTFDEAVKGSKSGREGRERGAMSYYVEEHTYLFSSMKSVANLFHASKSSSEWKALYKLMVGQYNNAFGYNCKPLATLQSHFVDMYSAFKNGIRGLYWW